MKMFSQKKSNATEENLTSKNRTFFDTWAKSYDRGPFQFWMKKFQVPVLEELKLQSPEIKILDLSCGTGELLLALWKQGKKNLFGVDLSEKMFLKSREKLPKEIFLQQGNVEHLPFPNNTFDYVISTEAFHHYPNQKKALEEMKRVVKKSKREKDETGGKIIITDINFFWRGIHWLFEIFEPGCVKVNGRKEILQLFQETGLQEIWQQRSFLFAVMTEGMKK